MSTTASLFHAVNIADTGKLVLLGLAVAAATRAMEDTGAVRGWLRGLGYALLRILVIGGLAFVIHSAAVSAVLDLLLLLLLLWAEQSARARSGRQEFCFRSPAGRGGSQRLGSQAATFAEARRPTDAAVSLPLRTAQSPRVGTAPRSVEMASKKSS